MSRDLAAQIVRRALAPEPVSADGRPRETPLEERLRVLHNALGGTQQRVDEQQAKLEKLRADLDEYRALMERVKEKAVAMERAASALPASAPAPSVAQDSSTERARAQSVDDSASAVPFSKEIPVPLPVGTVTIGPLPSLAAEPPVDDKPASPPRSLEDAVSPRLSWRQFVPYAAIVVFGAAMSLAVTRHPAPQSLKLAAVPPPPSLTVDAPLPAPAALPIADAPAPALSDEESNAVVLSLVSSYVPPGFSRSVGDILGPEMDDPTAESPWTIMRVDDKTTLVSFRPYGDVLESAPVYEFTVDPLAKTVTAGDETLANLRLGTASRQASR